MIREISWEKISHIWSTELWPQRRSAIEKTSAMNYLVGYDINNMSKTPTFFGYFVDEKIVGVNSGHSCNDGSYRSRGLWVDSKYRNLGIGKELLRATIQRAKKEDCCFIWSFPRYSSKNTYESVGFKIIGEWIPSETSDANAYCKLKL